MTATKTTIFDAIGETLIHELGHYFGMTEEEIDVVEDYWRGSSRRRRGLRATDEGPARVRARKRFAQHFLEAAWVTKLVAAVAATKDDTDSRDWPWPRGDHPAAGGSGRPRSRLKSIAISPPTSKPTDLTTSRWCAATSCRSTCPPCSKQWLGAPPGPGNRVRVVGNLPYNISSPILFRAAGFRRDDPRRPRRDADVAEGGRRSADGQGRHRRLRRPDRPDRRPRRRQAVPVAAPGAFRPQPGCIPPLFAWRFGHRRWRLADQHVFVRMVRTMFTQRRKTIANALKPFGVGTGVPIRHGAAGGAGIDPKRRPETLDLAEMAALARAFSAPVS